MIISYLHLGNCIYLVVFSRGNNLTEVFAYRTNLQTQFPRQNRYRKSTLPSTEASLVFDVFYVSLTSPIFH